MPLTHPDDLESTNGELYQSFFSNYDKIGDLDLRFSDSIKCPYCGQLQQIQLKKNVFNVFDVFDDGDDDDDDSDNVNDKNKVLYQSWV